MSNVLCILYLTFLNAKDGEYGVDFELTSLQSTQDNRAFRACFLFHTSTNCESIDIVSKGKGGKPDKVVDSLNHFFVPKTKTIYGQTSKIEVPFQMKKLSSGTFYFQLKTKDGKLYRSNLFSQNPNGLWTINRKVELPKNDETAKMSGKDKMRPKRTWFEMYRKYIIGLSAILLCILLYYGIKAYKNKYSV